MGWERWKDAVEEWWLLEDSSGPFKAIYRYKLSIVLAVLCLAPILNWLPDDWHAFVFEHPALLLGPPLILAPVIVSYPLLWDRVWSGPNLVLGAFIVMPGMVLSGMFEFLGLMSLPFVCPEGYPYPDFDVVIRTARRGLPVMTDMLCQGEMGTLTFQGNAVQGVTYVLYLVICGVCVAASLVLGMNSPLLGKREGSGEFHFLRYFVVVMGLCLAFLSLPEIVPSPAAGAISGNPVPMNERRIAYFSPLHGAVLEGNVERVQALLAEGADVNAVVNRGLTPVALAVQKGNLALVRLLVEAGADVNKGEASQQSAMQFGYASRNNNLVRFLLKHGGNRLAVSQHGAGALAEAVEALDLKAAKELLEAGADPNETDRDGQTLIYRTVFEVTTDYYKALQPKHRPHMAMAELLLDNGAALDVQDRHSDSPLTYAIGQDNVWMTELFLKRGADPNFVDNYGQNALHRALNQRFFEFRMADLLLAHGVDVNHRDRFGRTVLIYQAKHSGGVRELEWLLRNGADVNVKDEKGFTALDVLQGAKREEAKRKILLKAGGKSSLDL